MRLGRRRTPVLAEIGAGPPVGAGPGALRRRDMDAYTELLKRLDGPRAVLVTGDADGKRVAALGLAATATAAGRRSALLECDLASPSVAEALGLASAPGLGEYLRGESDVDRILKPVVLAGPGSGGATEPLVCVVAGRPTSEGATLLRSDGLARAMAGLRATYDLVVLAGPALHDEDSLAVLSPHVDTTIACVERAASRSRSPVPVAGLVIRG